MKTNYLIKLSFALCFFVLYSCSDDEDESVCTEPQNVCNPGQVEVLLTSCEDGEGKELYQVGDITYESLEDASEAAAAQCTNTAKADIDSRIQVIVASLRRMKL
ncbi:hypothetical protein [Reichenbachiella versicolor]|uniref:hypothetical protein n=1 Tax=Reichenbachiella versicolor TaxID=1821036 RepID=UPI000D6E8D22|nr:hypothetical protein [Reichenbachiella versicolor]